MSGRTFICRQNHDNSVPYRHSSTQNVGDASIENSKIKVAEKYLESSDLADKYMMLTISEMRNQSSDKYMNNLGNEKPVL